MNSSPNGFARVRGAIAALLATIAAACSQMSTVSPGYVNPGSWTFAQAVMAKGPMLVRVAGTPYAAPEGLIERRIEQEMARGLAWYANPRFSIDPAKAVGGSFFVSLIFNTGYVGAGQCALVSPAGGPPMPDGAMQLSAAFCDGTDQLGSVAGSLGESTGPDDPHFAALLQQIALALFPNPGLIPRNSGIGLQIGGAGVVFQ